MTLVSVRYRLEEVLDSLSEEKLMMLLRIALKIKKGIVIPETDESLSAEESEMVLASEEDYDDGESVCWRDVRRSDVQC